MSHHAHSPHLENELQIVKSSISTPVFYFTISDPLMQNFKFITESNVIKMLKYIHTIKSIGLI